MFIYKQYYNFHIYRLKPLKSGKSGRISTIFTIFHRIFTISGVTFNNSSTFRPLFDTFKTKSGRLFWTEK